MIISARVEATITVQPNGSQIQLEADDFDGTVNQFSIVGVMSYQFIR